MPLRILKAVLYLASVATAAVGVLGLVLWWWPASVGVVLGAVGRFEVCRFDEAVAGVEGKLTLDEVTQALRSKVRELETDKQAGLTRWDAPDGKYWVPSDTGAILPVLLAQQETHIYGFVKPGEIVLDGGAHVGVYTRRALDAGAKLVVAIEPAPDNIECLKRNFAAEIAAGRVIVYPKGVWDKDDVLELKTVRGNSAGDSFVISYGPGERLQLPLTTIDKLVDELKLERVDRIKLDIKGAEQQALRGAAGVIKRFRPKLAVATEHHPDDYVKIPKLIAELRPNSKIACGACFVSKYRIVPETLLVD